MSKKIDAKNKIQALIDENADILNSKKELKRYTEEDTKRTLVEPLFEALGWNFRSRKEISSEEKIKNLFADYGFYLNGVPVFYLETKGVRETINEEHVKQAINYAWLKGISWAVLTNFKGLKVFNADVAVNDPNQSRFFELNWEDFTDEEAFDLLWLLSKEAVQAGELDKRAIKYGRMPRREPVDKILFAQLTDWRARLFKEIQSYQPELTPQQIDDAVQRLLDRLIFIRTMEDRHIEEPRLLPILRQHANQKLFPVLRELFAELDIHYNATLFATRKSLLDEKIEIYDANLLRDIILNLYDVPRGYGKYNFEKISADILGNIYEQYLSFKADDREGKKSIAPTDRQLKRKTQGIYYTPQYVVRYIVHNTLGKLLAEGADPYQIRVLDPACGSGSFLLEAFDVLDRYLALHGRPEHQANPRSRREYILKHSLYGVDLDPQAVEVARLNLHLRTAHERQKLPMLEHIRVGNSLIDDPALTPHPFNWHKEFPEVFANGGFDVVIGNPPYVRQEFLGTQKSYFQQHYAVYHGSADLYTYFMEKSVELLKPKGLYSIIVANKWMRAAYGKPLRQWLKQQRIEEIIDFGDLPVFQSATTYPCIIRLQKAEPVEKFAALEVKTLDFISLDTYADENRYSISRAALSEKGWSLAHEPAQAILEKLKICGVPLSEYVENKVYYGIKTGLNEAFVIDAATRNKLIAKDSKSTDIIKPFLAGREVKRYAPVTAQHYLILFPTGWTRKNLPNGKDAWQWLKKNYPAIADYLEPYAQKAQKRSDKGEFWWELRPCDYYAEFDKPKIIYPNILKKPEFTYDTSGTYSNQKCFIMPSDDKYLLGVLNSSVSFFLFRMIFPKLRGDFYEPSYVFFKDFPIRKIDVENPAEKALHDRLVTLVEEMLLLKQQHAAAEAAFDDSRHALAHKIAQVDGQIDGLVYELYGLSAEEIGIVEGK